MPSALATLSRARPLTGAVNLTEPVAFLPRPDDGPAAACRACCLALVRFQRSAWQRFAECEGLALGVLGKLPAQDVIQIDDLTGISSTPVFAAATYVPRPSASVRGER